MSARCLSCLSPAPALSPLFYAHADLIEGASLAAIVDTVRAAGQLDTVRQLDLTMLRAPAPTGTGAWRARSSVG